MGPALDRAKFSLYVMYQTVPIASDNNYAEDLATTVRFALRIVLLRNNSEGCDGQIIQLQTGCIDLFATCLHSCCDRAAARTCRGGSDDQSHRRVSCGK